MPRATFDPTNLSYERMPGEPQKAFSAFRMYRDMGENRTLENVRVSLGKTPGYYRALERWSSDYEWVERSALWDNEQDRATRKESEKSIAFWEEQRQRSLLLNLQLAREMREKLHEMIKHPLTKEVIKDINGRPITIIQPSKWTLSTVATMAKTMAEMEAATIGEALTGAVDEGFDVETATIDELRDYINRTRVKRGVG